MSKLKKPSRGKWSNQLWHAYLDAREKLIDGIFHESDSLDMSLTDLAAEAGLSYQTVVRLNNYTTVEPRETTIWKLARAVGFEIEMKRVKKIKLKLKKVG
jgi:hypothetical protein